MTWELRPLQPSNTQQQLLGACCFTMRVIVDDSLLSTLRVDVACMLAQLTIDACAHALSAGLAPCRGYLSR